MSSFTTLISPSFKSRLRWVSQVASEKAAEIDPDGSLRETIAELLYSRPISITLSKTGSVSWADVVLIANVGNGCSTTEGSDVEFPNPGPDVSVQDTQTTPPVGKLRQHWWRSTLGWWIEL